MSRRPGPPGRWKLQSGQGVRVRVGGRIYLNFASDDYLDLAADPRVARAAAAAALRYGCGAGASPLFSGSLPPHRALERALALREDAGEALVFESAPLASRALLGALTGRGAAVFCDALGDPGLVDACFLSGVPVHLYRHADLDHLEQLLRGEEPAARRRLVVTDTLFGATGDLAPLAEIAALAGRYGAAVVADESHAAGVLGENGRGLAEGLPGRHRILTVATLGKAFGSQGGFVCGPRGLRARLARRSPLAASAGSLAVPAAAAARRALALADEEPDRRRRALASAERLRRLLQDRGIPTGPSQAQIVSVPLGRSPAAVRLSGRLEVLGLLVPVIRPPLVPAGMAGLRVSLTAGHTDADVDRLVECLADAWTDQVP